tara:strand:+ start:425 stop:625 length:201 start_codon:yes stop_codon:yes gene_type:complete
MNLKYLFLLILLVFPSNSAYAYLDPGTGSIILQAIFGLIAAIGAYITLFWRKFKDLIRKIFKKKRD